MSLRDTGHIRCSAVVLASIGRNLMFNDLSYSGEHIYAGLYDGTVL
jgi:hypothetical protein